MSRDGDSFAALNQLGNDGTRGMRFSSAGRPLHHEHVARIHFKCGLNRAFHGREFRIIYKAAWLNYLKQSTRNLPHPLWATFGELSKICQRNLW